MSAVDDILRQIPMDQLADQVGEDPATTEAVAGEVVQTLLHGMSANAEDPNGEASLAQALAEHAQSPVIGRGVDLAAVDPADGEAIVRHIFGAQTGNVVQTLGQASPKGSSDLIGKLLPILAPIVLAYLGKRLSQSNSPYGDVLGQILGGALGGQAQTQHQAPQSGGFSLPDILGQVLGGRRAPQTHQAPQTQQAPQPQGGGLQQAPAQPTGDAPQTIDVEQPQAQQSQAGSLGGDILAEILKGMLGGGRR
ncbi:hypothetical protein GCM10027418_21920 [Mariniluteicoccus endophyticus]